MGEVDGQLTINDLSFVNSAGVTELNLFNLVSDMLTWFTGTLAPQLSHDWSTTRVVGTDLSNPVGPRIEASSNTPGGVSAEAAPNNVAACVSLRTAQRGRSGHGRNYIPALPNTLVDLNTLDSAFATNLLIAYSALIGAGSFSAGWQLCIVSRETGGAARPVPITIPVTGVTFVTNKVKSMRSREVGHGA
jgi:hypothetical protein